MIQTVTQNGALSQNWVKCTRCTPKGPRATRTLRLDRLQAARWALCRVALSVVSWPPSGRVAGRVACYATGSVVAPWSRYKICITTQFPAERTTRRVARLAACRVHCGVCHRAPTSCRSPCRDTKAAPPPQYKTLYRDTPSGQAGARAAARPARRPAVS